MTLVRARQRKWRCKATPPRGQLHTGGYRHLPAVTVTYRCLWPPPNTDFRQNGRSQKQTKYL
eukprot:11337247-Heterocapsa_arctica.AAC.1